MIALRLCDLTSDFASLTGVTRARQLLARLIEWTASSSPKGVLILDFDGVADASASFLRESILAFRDYARSYQPELFPVLANIAPSIFEEFDLLLRERREAMLACRTDGAGRPGEPAVLGVLDRALADTLDQIRARGSLTLSDLRQAAPDINPTTWSNRLANLLRQGFIVPTPEPTRRAFRFVLAEEGGNDGA